MIDVELKEVVGAPPQHAMEGCHQAEEKGVVPSAPAQLTMPTQGKKLRFQTYWTTLGPNIPECV